MSYEQIDSIAIDLVSQLTVNEKSSIQADEKTVKFIIPAEELTW